jgi:hypothetical protein
MMRIPPTEIPLLRMRNDRFTAELRAYARDEFRSDPGWLQARALSRRVSWTSRLRRWWTTLAERRTAPTGEPVAEPIVARAEPANVADEPPCPHAVVEELGLDVTTRFLRCTACGSVLVIDTRSRWWLPAGSQANEGSDTSRISSDSPLESARL